MACHEHEKWRDLAETALNTEDTGIHGVNVHIRKPMRPKFQFLDLRGTLRIQTHALLYRARAYQERRFASWADAGNDASLLGDRGR